MDIAIALPTLTPHQHRLYRMLLEAREKAGSLNAQEASELKLYRQRNKADKKRARDEYIRQLHSVEELGGRE